MFEDVTMPMLKEASDLMQECLCIVSQRELNVHNNMHLNLNDAFAADAVCHIECVMLDDGVGNGR